MQNALRQNHDVFAWAHSDMKRIHLSITSHKLNVLPTARPIRQRVRRFHPDRQAIIRNEIDKLLEAGFIREVDYSDWLANVVVFPFARINQIVDSTAGQGCSFSWTPSPDITKSSCPPVDEEKTAFITPHGLYCYKIMPFQTQKRWRHLLETDDKDLQTSSRPHSRVLANSWDSWLGQRGIELEQADGRTAVKALLIKLNICLMQPPILSSPIPKEKLYMYLAVLEWAISAVLFRCPSPKEQKPIYYVSRALADVETRYSKMELMTLALRSAAQKLCPYFQAHSVVVSN
ncbi:hypothetical protein CK203_098058 [Vitis vinifera]|uniref:Reverse transcriptase/retrotransposon-derived protein RNase H-like domain-containing protein n=1 Tax=Vitis vinifera TaxID=29760 RepID=A0A438CRZ0_VITVI|nr:hypothetical protein CK203_098058 [Vitis vinifera]